MFWTLQPFTYSLWRRAYSRNVTLQETLKLRCPIHHINSAARTKLSCATSAWYIISYRIISYKAQVKLLLAVAVGEPFLSKNVPTAKSRISQRLYFPTVKNKQLCGPQMLVACSYMLILPAISTSSRILIPSKNDSSSSSSSWIQITVMVFWKAFTDSRSDFLYTWAYMATREISVILDKLIRGREEGYLVGLSSNTTTNTSRYFMY